MYLSYLSLQRYSSETVGTRRFSTTSTLVLTFLALSTRCRPNDLVVEFVPQLSRGPAAAFQKKGIVMDSLG